MYRLIIKIESKIIYYISKYYSPSKKKLYRYKYYGVSYILFIVNNIY